MGTDTDQADQTADANASRSPVGRILDWLTAGYPEGIPPADRFPVVAVLKRRLTDDQVREIVATLTAKGSPGMTDGSITLDEVEEHIAHVTQEPPTDDEIRRVSARLAAGGWPLAGSEGSDEPAAAPAGGAA